MTMRHIFIATFFTLERFIFSIVSFYSTCRRNDDSYTANWISITKYNITVSNPAATARVFSRGTSNTLLNTIVPQKQASIDLNSSQWLAIDIHYPHIIFNCFCHFEISSQFRLLHSYVNRCQLKWDQMSKRERQLNIRYAYLLRATATY